MERQFTEKRASNRKCSDSPKIYVEDYVYTYLNKLAQPENLYARGAILFGKMYKTSIGKCMFISGAAACQNFELDLDETIFFRGKLGRDFIE